MRHTTLTRWIETADARQACVGAAPVRPQARSKVRSSHRQAIKNSVCALAISVPLALAVIGATTAASTISHSTARLDCTGFPAVACHPAQVNSLSLSS